MASDDEPTLQPPFDGLSATATDAVQEAEATAPAGAAVAPPAGARAARRFDLRLLGAAALIAAAGFGQALGLSWWFGKRVEHLRPESTLAAVPVPPPARESEGADAADGPPAAKHELEVARERFAMGDVEGARRTAAAFLLLLDGLGEDEMRRAPEALTLLGDVLRHEYERASAGAPR